MAKDEMDRKEGPCLAEVERLRARVAELEELAAGRRQTEEMIRRLADENAIIAEIGRIIGSTLRIDEVYERFAEATRRLIPSERVVITLLDQGNETSTLAHVAGHTIPAREKGASFPVHGNLIGEILRERRSALCQGEEMEALRRKYPSTLALHEGFRSILVIPLISQDRAIGGLAFYSFRPAAYSQRHRELGESVAAQIAGAIANAHLFAERLRADEALVASEAQATRLAGENGIIAEIGKIINSSLAIEEVYERFAAEARKLIPFDRLNVNLIDYREQIGMIAYISGRRFQGKDPGDSFPLEGSVCAEVIRGGTGLIIHSDDPEELARRYPQWVVPQAGFETSMAVPLPNRGRIIGVLIFSSFQEKQYAEGELPLATHIANQISGAIANAQLFSAAKQTQEALARREQELERNNFHLGELNSALKVLLRQMDENKTDIEKKVLTNIKKLVTNFFAKLRKTQLTPHQVEYLNLIEDNLRRVTAPFLHNLESKFLNLTPRELEIAYLIKEGRNTKEIGELLHVSPRSIEFHRDHLRKKLGLKERRANLRSYLSSLT